VIQATAAAGAGTGAGPGTGAGAAVGVGGGVGSGAGLGAGKGGDRMGGRGGGGEGGGGEGGVDFNTGDSGVPGFGTTTKAASYSAKDIPDDPERAVGDYVEAALKQVPDEIMGVIFRNALFGIARSFAASSSFPIAHPPSPPPPRHPSLSARSLRPNVIWLFARHT